MAQHGHTTPTGLARQTELHARFLALGEVANLTAQLEAEEDERAIAIGRAVEFGANSNQLAQATKTTPGKMKRDYPDCVHRKESDST